MIKIIQGAGFGGRSPDRKLCYHGRARVWGLATYEIAEEGEVDIQLVLRQARKVSIKEYIERLKKTLAKTSVSGGRPMVMQVRIKGILKVGDADIEVKIRGDEIDKLLDLARQPRNP